MAVHIRCVDRAQAKLGEGPIWVAAEQALYWVDIRERAIHRFNPATQERRTFATPYRIGSLAPRIAGGFVAGSERGFVMIDQEFARYEVVHNPEPEMPGNRFNDGKVDVSGRFWAGTMDDAEAQASGALYRFDPDQRCTCIEEDYKVPNGPAFSPDGRVMYHSDSARQVIYRFNLTPEGAPGARSAFATFLPEDGYPDGMTTDSQGRLWVAFWDSWCIRQLSPEAEVLRVVEMPVQRPTSCAFGGPQLETLFVTSARIGLDYIALVRQPDAGGLFAIDGLATGVASIPFAG